jgi:hypothetical protein
MVLRLCVSWLGAVVGWLEVFATAAAGFTTALIACRCVSLFGVVGQATVLACSLAPVR